MQAAKPSASKNSRLVIGVPLLSMGSIIHGFGQRARVSANCYKLLQCVPLFSN